MHHLADSYVFLIYIRKKLHRIELLFITETPVLITEFGAKGSDAASRVFFSEMLTKLCRDNYISTFLWDDGSEFDRTSFTWHTPALIKALKRATSGNSYVPAKLDSLETEESQELPTYMETSEPATSSETTETETAPEPQDSVDPILETYDTTSETFQSLY